MRSQKSIYLALLWATAQCCVAYAPELNHRSIAGLWKLVQQKEETSNKPSRTYPMKEFTVVPVDRERDARLSEARKHESAKHEMLLMLKEDGSFQQYGDKAKQDEQIVVPDRLSFHMTDEYLLTNTFGKVEGKWDFVDGKLLLAANRPKNFPDKTDTLLIGEVVATSEASLAGNPIVMDANTTARTRPAERGEVASSTFDTHLSVPKGKVNIGRFTYPSNHPSFFEQPMFKPKQKGKFELKQVLGSLNAGSAREEKELVEKFRTKDFYDKRFLLTSHPLGTNKPSGKMRWSIKYNKYVADVSPTMKKKQEEEEGRPLDVRVMEVHFFANNTFATVRGTGQAILRGKFHIVGEERDAIWMQVWRFGFGRSVSGSVYSEGTSLTKDDEKTYWGKISFIPIEDVEGKVTSNDPAGDKEDVQGENKAEAVSNERLSVRGSVIFGSGLEPQPVGRFVMTEIIDMIEEDDEYDDDDGDDDRITGIDKDFDGFAGSFQ